MKKSTRLLALPGVLALVVAGRLGVPLPRPRGREDQLVAGGIR